MNKHSKKDSPTAKPWAGRFQSDTEALLEQFTASVQIDWRLYRHDIQGSIAHARTLEKAEVITTSEATQIINALTQIGHQIERGEMQWSEALEDVHMNIESWLIEMIGEAGKKLHTGRSRNDQVATDLRLYVREEIEKTQGLIAALQSVLVQVAEREIETVMPGYTHLQVAQPVSFGHHLLAWFEMLKRDWQRLSDAYQRVNVMPLGSAALAGTSFPIDRQYTAELLGFERVSDNSLDAVSDRDFAIEVCAACALLMMHLSRFSEEMVLWASQPFDFIELPDAYCTGSSIMPQKKNPDGAELIRGKSGRVYGDLMSLLTIMKGQPLAYNRDNQEDKTPLFDALDTVTACLVMMTEMIGALSVNRKQMMRALEKGYATATDLADYLVIKGSPFRTAHALTGRIVALAAGQDTTLAALQLTELQAIAPEIEADVYDVLKPANALAGRNSYGGTAPSQVARQIEKAKQYLKQIASAD